MTAESGVSAKSNGREALAGFSKPTIATTPDSGRFLLVTLESDLPACRTTFTAAWRCILNVPGVRSVVDVAVISRETLDAILFQPPAPPIEVPDIEAQPGLPGW